jgi:hypothetical protein
MRSDEGQGPCDTPEQGNPDAHSEEFLGNPSRDDAVFGMNGLTFVLVW